MIISQYTHKSNIYITGNIHLRPSSYSTTLVSVLHSSQGTPAPVAASTSNFSVATNASASPVATQELSQTASQTGLTNLPSIVIATPSVTRDGTPALARPGAPGEDDVEGEDELLPAMADDDYSAQLSWQSQSKDNLKCVNISSSCLRVANDAYTRPLPECLWTT